MRVNGVSWLILVAVLGAVPLQARDDPWGNWQAQDENDTFAAPGRGSDEFYTQGLRFVFTRELEETWPWAERLGTWWGRRFWTDAQFETHSSLVIGENHFTPGLITTFDVDPQDRPFAGLLYGGARVEMLGTKKLAYQALEFDVGILGPPGLGEPLQSGFHVLRQHRVPRGWKHQLRSEPMLAAHYQNRRQYGLGTRHGNVLDVTRDFGAVLGTLQAYPTVGATVRLGYRMTGMTASSGYFSGMRGLTETSLCEDQDGNRKRCPFEFGLQAGADARYFLRNGYYDGNLFRDGPRVDKDPFVYDLRYGAYFRLHSWRFSWNAIHRSREFSPVPRNAKHRDGTHDFGSITVSREFTCEQCTQTDADRNWWQRDWLFEFGIGVGRLSLDPEPPGGRTIFGHSGRYGFAKGLTRHLMLGAEVAGVVREGPRLAPSNAHDDTFLTASAVVLSVRPFAGRKPPEGADAAAHADPKRGLGRLRLRVGVGRGEAKYEATGDDGLAFLEETEKGLAVTLGADYTFRMGDQLALGLNANWARLKVDERRFERGSFLSTAVVAYWQP